MKKTLAIIVSAILILALISACGNSAPQAPATPAAPDAPNAPEDAETPETPETPDAPVSNFDANRLINVVSREDGSGTRGAFIEIFGVLQDGEDRTTQEAHIADGTNLVLTTVEGDAYAIGYVSMGALTSDVKALAVDGVQPTVANVNNGTYTVMRPFNIAYKQLNEAAQDFYDFIFSDEGQAVVESRGYITVDATGPFVSTMASGTVTVSGSTSVFPVMERLIEAYEAINTNARIDLQGGGSSAGMRDAVGGISDIGMASRDLSDDEIAELSHRAICIDGIAVIANLENPLDNISSDDVTLIFIGELTQWSDIQ